MSSSTNKITELLDVVDGGVDTWVSMADYREYCVLATAAGASPAANVTIQLRKATSAAGAGAADHGTAVTGEGGAKAQLFAEDLGGSYTHVAAVITDDVSPDQAHAVAFRIKGRFTP